MSAVNLRHIFSLPVAGRLQFLEEIWDSLAADPESFSLTEGEKAELHRRLAYIRAHPDQGRSWEEARESLEAS